MRHLAAGRRLGRKSGHWRADFRNLATALLKHQRIRTTEGRAKELRKVVERLITLSKRVLPSQVAASEGDAQRALVVRRVHSIRLARRWVTDREVLRQLFDVYGERYRERPGGYTRIVKIGRRPGDNAAMTVIELVDAGAGAPVAEALPASGEAGTAD